ncbi:MAG TPA: hypothetical protein VMB24_01545, partial [Dehalococcoidales bacterium]|nr:hypothetical protein [Dehalococcoidales bacterium]
GAVIPMDAYRMIQQTAVLVSAVNDAGIPNNRIFVDPGLLHITNVEGQRHLVHIIEFLRALPDATEPPVKSTCWLANSSAGAKGQSRHAIETALLPLLAGAGLSSVFMDALNEQNRRALRLIKVFNNKIVYAESESLA